MDEIIGDDVRLQGEARGRAHIAQFLADDRVEGEVQARAAISFGDLRTEQPSRADLGPGLAFDHAILFMRVHARGDNGIKDLANGVAEGVMVLAEQGAV